MNLLFFILFIFTSVFSDEIHILKLSSSINPASSDFLINKINNANNNNDVRLIIIELNTPGGLVKSTRTLVQSILSSRVPIAVNITPPGAHAGSAGVMITLAADIAAMAPGTNIGAAHPVNMLPFNNMGNNKNEDNKNKQNKNIVQEKALNDILAFVKSIAKTRNRNVIWAQSSVTNNATLIPKEALKLNVIDFVVNSSNDLIKKLNNYEYVNISGDKKVIKYLNPNIVYKSMGFKDRFLNFLADPNFAFFLMIIAAIGIYLEFSNPGLILPGTVGGISFFLFLMSTQILPITATGIVLLILGLVLIVSELFVTSGLLGVGGTVSILLSGVFFLDKTKTDLSVSGFVLWPLALVLLISVLLITYLIYKTKKLNSSKGVSKSMGVMLGNDAPVGEVVSFNNKKKEGKVLINSEYWNFISDDSFNVGDNVKIIDRKGLTLIGGKFDD